MKFNKLPVPVASEQMKYLGINLKIYMCETCALKTTEKNATERK